MEPLTVVDSGSVFVVRILEFIVAGRSCHHRIASVRKRKTQSNRHPRRYGLSGVRTTRIAFGQRHTKARAIPYPLSPGIGFLIFGNDRIGVSKRPSGSQVERSRSR